jgi:hypothetical protein
MPWPSIAGRKYYPSYKNDTALKNNGFPRAKLARYVRCAALDPDVTFWDVMLFQGFGMDHRGLDARPGSYGLSRYIGAIIAFPY